MNVNKKPVEVDFTLRMYHENYKRYDYLMSLLLRSVPARELPDLVQVILAMNTVTMMDLFPNIEQEIYVKAQEILNLIDKELKIIDQRGPKHDEVEDER